MSYAEIVFKGGAKIEVDVSQIACVTPDPFTKRIEWQDVANPARRLLMIDNDQVAAIVFHTEIGD